MIDPRCDYNQRRGEEAGDVDPYFQLAHRELSQQAIIGLLIEPPRLLWLGPRDDVITFAAPLSPAEVGCAILMPPRGELDAQLPQQREQGSAAVVPVGQHQVVEQRAEQRGLTGLLARVGTGRQRQDHAR